MLRKSLNRILAENLRALMDAKNYNESTLAKRAGVAPNTIGNYCEIEPQYTAKGKERSAKLAEIEAIAGALGVHPLTLLTDQAEQLARAQQIAEILAGGSTTPPIPPSRKRLPRAAPQAQVLHHPGASSTPAFERRENLTPAEIVHIDEFKRRARST